MSPLKTHIQKQFKWRFNHHLDSGMVMLLTLQTGTLMANPDICSNMNFPNLKVGVFFADFQVTMEEFFGSHDT